MPESPQPKTNNLRAMGDHVVIRRRDSEKQSKGGIVLPDTAKDKLNRGTVVAVGPGVFLMGRQEKVRPEVSVGDDVWFSAYAGSKIVGEGDEELIVCRESDILAVVV